MRNRNRAGVSLPPELILLWGALLFSSGLAFANPTGPTVVRGTAAFQQSGNLLQVTNSPNTIINWQGFSIPVGEITRFNQQSAASAVLNRVTTQSPSAILGALQSNGRVFIINPNGILFGASSQVDVAGLVASTLNLSDLDFLGGRLRFTAAPGAGSVINQGSILSAPGGQVYLVGPAVTNGGVINSPKGEVILAAGNSVDLVDPQTPNLRVEITAPDNQVLNLGQITANAGRVGIYAGLINHSGTIRADSAVATADGKIVFKATKSATLEAGSVTAANGPAGGRIEIQAADTTLVAGTVEAKGAQATGGTVHVLGSQVGVIDKARINASGETGGGTVLAGGDLKGGNSEIQNASRTYFGRDATIAADAITGGDGGKVVVWSNDATRAYGSISARGGAQSGKGGLVEVSGRNWLDFAAHVNTTAPNGATGTLLLDPTDITIGGGATSGGTCPPAGPCFDLVADPSSANLNAADLIAALGTSNVTVSTSSGGSGAGDINVVTGVPYSSANSLTLRADRDLNMVTPGGSIGNGGTGALALEAGRDFTLRDASVVGFGPVAVTADNMNLTAVTAPTSLQGTTLTVNLGGGLRIQSGVAPTAIAQIFSFNGQTINARFVEITAQENTAGIFNAFSGSQVISTSGMNAAGEGIVLQGGSSGSGNRAVISGNNDSQQVNTSAAGITLIGGSGGANNFAAINQDGTGPQSLSAAGIVLRGGSSGSGNSALISANGSQLINAGAGGVALLAGSSGANNFVGINQNGAGSGLIQTVTVSDGGSISIQGGSGGTINQAQIRALGGLQSVTADNIALTGGTGSASNFALILAPVQSTTIHGDLTLSAGDSAVRVGGLGGATPGPTNLVLTVDGDITMTGGSATNAVSAIGSSQVGGLRSDIAMNVGGNVTLNPGSVAGAESRIGSPSGNVAGGYISVNAGGNIVLNSAGPGLGTGIFTLDAVALSTLTPGKTITQGVDSIIRTDSLGVTANGNISLIGANQVGSIFSGGTGLGGSLAFNNTSPALTVPGIILAGGGALSLNQAGNLFITSNVFSGTQTIAATGDITVAPGSGPGINVFTAGPQTINAGGTLSIVGGSASNGSAQVMTNSAQSISAANVRLEGGSGTNAFSEIRQNGGLGSQTITVNNGGTLSLQGGLSGADSFAQVLSFGPAQQITFPSGGSIVLTGGSGPNIPPPGDTSNNFARIVTSGVQNIHTGSINLNGATAGANNFTEIAAFQQFITATEDVTLQGHPASNSSSRIGGGPFVQDDTRLVLHVGGDLTLNGGALGGGPFASNNFVAVDTGGDITLNPGVGFVPRIGSPSTNIVGGHISLAAGGNIALNSAGPGLGSGIFTLGGVALGTLTPGKTITQGVDSSIRSGSLGVSANGDVSLIGANQVGILIGNIGLGAGLSFNNTSPALTLQGINLDGGGALTVNQAGNLLVTSYVSSGAQTINASGDLSVAPPPFSSPGISVNASGSQTLSAGGTFTVQGGSGLDASAVVTASGPTNVTVGNDLVLTGGSGQNAQALLFSNGDINLTIGGALRINAGSGDNAWARVQTATRDSMINIHFPNLSSGGYFVNDIEGALRRGFTGILSGEGAAAPGQTLEITYGQ